MIIKIVLALSLFSVSATAAQFCEDVFVSAGQQVINGINNDYVYTRLVTRENIIDGRTLDVVDQTVAQLIVYGAYLKKLPPEQLLEERRQFLTALSQAPFASKVFDVIFTSPGNSYGPGEYGLRKDINSRIAKALRELPPEFRVKIAKLPFDSRLQKLNVEAVGFMKELEVRFDNLFLKGSGYKSYSEYEQFIRQEAERSEPVKKAIELIEKDQIEIMMRRPESGRYWTPRVGFQNQYSTGSSKGYFGNQGRQNAETILTHRTKEEYLPLDNELKPKYGTLAVAEGNGVANNIDGSSQYGSDLYYFKKSAIKERLSFFPGDSLNHLHDRGYNWKEGGEPVSWDSMLIPWSRRLLMVPFMSGKNTVFSSPDLGNARIPKGYSSVSRHRYWEAQIFGHLSLDMVERFEFQGKPPTPEFVKELKKRNIKIMDGRVHSPAIEWNGNE